MQSDFMPGVLLADFRIRQRPEDCVQQHEQCLCEYPGQVNNLGLQLTLHNLNVEGRGIVALLSSVR